MEYKVHLLKGLLFLVTLLLLLSHCNNEELIQVSAVDMKRIDGIQVSNNIDQPEHIMEGFLVNEELGIAYSIDFRKQLPFRLSLESGEFEFLGSTGSGPTELRTPSQLTLKNDAEFFVYDTNQDMIAHFFNGEIYEKTQGFLKHNVWLRNNKGFFWKNQIITSIKDPARINALDFENARPIAILNLSDSTLTKHGKFSPTLDDLDRLQKYPILVLDNYNGVIYYVFRSDYTVMKYDLHTRTSAVASSYKPEKMRTRTIPFDNNNAYHYSLDFTRELNEDRTQLVGIDILEDQLVVVHQNTDAKFYDNRDPKYIDYFGVLYDLPDLENPREFMLPGKFLGTWENRLLIEENDDLMEYTIGFYEFVESVP